MCVFISGQTKAATKAQVDKVRASAVAAGRNPDDMQLLGEAIQLMSGARAVIVRGPIKQLDTGAMNKLGWYRA